MNKQCLIDVGNTDWGLLHKQKVALFDAILKKRVNKSKLNLLEGLLNFLDSVQDSAAEKLGEKAVFESGRK